MIGRVRDLRRLKIGKVTWNGVRCCQNILKVNGCEERERTE